MIDHIKLTFKLTRLPASGQAKTFFKSEVVLEKLLNSLFNCEKINLKLRQSDQ